MTTTLSITIGLLLMLSPIITLIIYTIIKAPQRKLELEQRIELYNINWIKAEQLRASEAIAKL